jgi:hypothetical protein
MPNLSGMHVGRVAAVPIYASTTSAVDDEIRGIVARSWPHWPGKLLPEED